MRRGFCCISREWSANSRGGPRRDRSGIGARPSRAQAAQASRRQEGQGQDEVQGQDQDAARRRAKKS
jgi:hypothetical protein